VGGGTPATGSVMMPPTGEVRCPDGRRKDEEALAASLAHPEEPLVIWNPGCHRSRPRAFAETLQTDEIG